MQPVLLSAMVSSVWFCCCSGPGTDTQLRPGCDPLVFMLKGVTLQGLVWGSYEAIFLPLVPPRRGSKNTGLEIYQERKGQRRVLLQDQQYERPRGLNSWPGHRGKVTLGVRSLFPQVCPLLGNRGFLPWWPSVPSLSPMLCSCLSVCLLYYDASQIIDSLAKEEIELIITMIIYSNLESRVLNTNTVKPIPIPWQWTSSGRKLEIKQYFNVFWYKWFSQNVHIYLQWESINGKWCIFLLKNVLMSVER